MSLSQELYAHAMDPAVQWTVPPLMEELKEKAREARLWNLFLPGVSGFTQLEYAPMAEEMGRCPFASEVNQQDGPVHGRDTVYLSQILIAGV